ncbi:MAG: hypothetical protein RBT39_11630 [Azoarcus sp.]|jgi:hypothetical protein|nr:hypothetical protein [Azoarcus sp.]MDD2874465.1 hypothetical protein [Azoarcus sp.]MDX9838205.1 hypothetical protein [Azoarcus sp.]
MPSPDERSEAIAQLRQSSKSLLSHLPESGEALLVLSCGVAVINESHAYAKTIRGFEANVDERFIRFVYGVAHEAVHMIQLLSTPFVHEIAIEYANLCARTQERLKAGVPEASWLPDVLRDYRTTQARLSASGPGFSTLQVLEIQAVIEGFRGAFSKYSELGLAKTVQIAHGLESLYAEAIGRLLASFGFTFTFEVVPKLCWIAMHAQDPGKTFTQGLLSLGDGDLTPLETMPACEICENFGLDPEKLARSIRIRYPEMRNLAAHALFGDYFDVLERAPDPETYLQRVMHPGRDPGSGRRAAGANLMPPLTIFNDDGFLMNGPLKDKGWDVADPLIRISTLITQTLEWLDERAADMPDTSQ